MGDVEKKLGFEVIKQVPRYTIVETGGFRRNLLLKSGAPELYPPVTQLFTKTHTTMAFSKKHLYPLDDQRLAEYCKALAYPGRLEILRTLQIRGKLTVQELHQHHPISEETFSDHLAVLRKAQLIDSEERFPYTFYMVRESNVQQALLLITAYLTIFSN
jgi:DNA-binding transcriptional ArsR family regulator